MKKIAVIALGLSFTLMLAACANENSKENNTPQPTTSTAIETMPVEESGPVVTDVSEPDVELHETIIKQTFEDGETIENLFYKVTKDENGEKAYEVIQESDNNSVLLPASNTVIYTSDSEDCYYEKTTYTYKMDGEDVQVEQYNLFVTEYEPTD